MDKIVQNTFRTILNFRLLVPAGKFCGGNSCNFLPQLQNHFRLVCLFDDFRDHRKGVDMDSCGDHQNKLRQNTFRRNRLIEKSVSRLEPD
ncbi:MAG: hypothetical protein COT43_07150 [Candidatus Marinimicrobia bacterium CG08_land_8_20_14_0_20_45_22]|nr:MAG: hypothetical protein COT43_07150 [Candidatus Marinimicrobia bacterium CG08_land_8_20_14_0_20_45_22]